MFFFPESRAELKIYEYDRIPQFNQSEIKKRLTKIE